MNSQMNKSPHVHELCRRHTHKRANAIDSSPDSTTQSTELRRRDRQTGRQRSSGSNHGQFVAVAVDMNPVWQFGWPSYCAHSVTTGCATCVAVLHPQGRVRIAVVRWVSLVSAIFSFFFLVFHSRKKMGHTYRRQCMVPYRDRTYSPPLCLCTMPRVR